MRIGDWSSDVCSSDLLILTPALCATILKPHDPGKSEGDGPLARFFRWFNDKFDRGTRKYEGGVRRTANSWKRSGFVYLMIEAAMGLIFMRLPGEIGRASFRERGCQYE